MKVRVICVASEDLVKVCNSVCVFLQDRLESALLEREYGAGIDQFSVALVAVDSDDAENERFASPLDKVGYFKHFVTGQKTKFLGFACKFDPQDLVGRDESYVLAKLIASLDFRLEAPGRVKIPKAFNYSRFVEDLRGELMKIDWRA